MVMMLTAASEKSSDRQGGLSWCADDYLVKPLKQRNFIRGSIALTHEELSDQLKKDNTRLGELNAPLSENLGGSCI